MVPRARTHLAALPFVALVLVAPVDRLRSQEAHGHGGKPPRALGHVVFPTSCSAEARPRFERGVALLHSFWYEEAAKTFRETAAADSTCAMSYWGQAMSLLHPLWTPPGPAESREGLTAAERAIRLSRAGSRERAYADAIATYYRDYSTVDATTRLIAYESAMQRVAQRYPQDREAQIFYALALIAHGQLDVADTTFARQRRAGEILEPLFEKQPDHPGLAHYLIHAYDYPLLAARGVAAAQRYARVAPSVPHALHMPSHIYTRLGEWEQSIVSNRRSAEAGRKFEESEHLNALWDQRGHALDYLTYAYLQEGRDMEAKRVLDEATAVTVVFPANSLTNDYALAAIPARYALERGRWADAKQLAVRPSPAWPAAEAISHFARAVGAARSGDTASARTEVESLGQIEAALAKAGGPQTYWSVQVKIQRLAASAWLAHAKGDSTEALQQAAAAADLEDQTEKHPVTPGAVLPARELYGDLLLELDRPAEARRAYEASLARQPNRARSLFGAARAAELMGDRAAAVAGYRQYLQLMSKADSHRTELDLAHRALASR
jgi:tetratricopeptide (TPR) repeat protein